MIHKTTIDFLKNLENNNNREWFLENKTSYEKAKLDFENFVINLIAGISSFDSNISYIEAKKCIFRIYRDTRFSKNKTPFKTNFGAHINAFGTKTTLNSGSAGYYLHLEPGKSFLAGGAYMPESSWLHKIRKKIESNPKKFISIIEDNEFKNYFKLEGDKLKRPPTGFSSDSEIIEFLKYKSFTVIYYISDEQITNDGFLDLAIDAFTMLKEFNNFLNDV